MRPGLTPGVSSGWGDPGVTTGWPQAPRSVADLVVSEALAKLARGAVALRDLFGAVNLLAAVVALGVLDEGEHWNEDVFECKGGYH